MYRFAAGDARGEIEEVQCKRQETKQSEWRRQLTQSPGPKSGEARGGRRVGVYKCLERQTSLSTGGSGPTTLCPTAIQPPTATQECVHAGPEPATLYPPRCNQPTRYPISYPLFPTTTYLQICQTRTKSYSSQINL
ncbi:hypothetical protein CBL_05356 [Carabus blaptoides fortunei]